jgi:hypothetical protein
MSSGSGAAQRVVVEERMCGREGPEREGLFAAEQGEEGVNGVTEGDVAGEEAKEAALHLGM